MTTTLTVGLVMLLSLPGLILSFQPLIALKSTTHRDITQRAVLRKTAEVCRDIAASNGWPFSLTIDNNLSADKVQKACSSPDASKWLISSIRFHISIITIYMSNAIVDVRYILSEKHHFDDETFQAGRDLITAGVSAVKASVRKGRYFRGKWTLGQVCHTLQDFYSHSNWVELGNTAPYSTLIQPDEPFENLAGPTTPTCRNCIDENCNDNLLPEVLQQGLLTSGYFSFSSSKKPAGKCSHGGFFDRSSRGDPAGGINKDDIKSNHGAKHHQAADLAVDATMELLQDIRVAVGDKNFLRMMGISQSSVLCFVIDTTSSMSTVIAEAKRVSFHIIDSKRGTQQEPSAYILVPFNDPDVGPLSMTSDPDVFKRSINQLSAKGGGDVPELSLSGLQLALTTAPPSSEIFVFTDAPAKDALLKSTITALIESTKSVVNFILTESRRTHRIFLGRNRQSGFELYRDLARASGGQAIEVAKTALSQATTVIEDSSADALVTVFQTVKNPGRPDRFTFTVDGLLRNMTVYITGSRTLTFRVTSPTGVSQSSSQLSGPLASLTTAGNLFRLRLNADSPAGSWQISVNSYQLYSIKVTGQSSVNFIYNLVEAHEGPHSDFSPKEGRPFSGGNVSLMVSVTGSDDLKVTEVTLFDSTKSKEINGSLQSFGSGNFLVKFADVPAGGFAVCLKGEETSSSSTAISFQRQASTQIKTSSISVTAQVDKTDIEPGSTISIPFTVASTSNGVVNSAATGMFIVRANNDRSYASTSPGTVSIAAGSGGKANGIVTLTVPASAASGSDVTLTIEVEKADASDLNYSVLRFTVASKVTDISRPVCHGVSTSCPSSSSPCASSQWVFIANVTDGINGTGIESVTIHSGRGTLTTRTMAGASGENITVATYSASCCSQNVELAVVDKVGNVGTCVGQAGVSTTAKNKAAVNTTSTRGHALSISIALLVTVVVSLVWK
ncbi:von Willebrand factor A domain-containing protein 7 [Anabas testudineus]|uniref:von Willebrand factor A domain-containing protein 7-like n=1 Tax=Anabas testudineus TaxID=64144 RepID=A0A3Q1J4X0_ANATE|nr:von Willebrand factor A domain-containing protein 7 [Anabas testudineus]